jgi:hypothetical protein
VKSGKIGLKTQVKRDGMTKYVAASAVKGLVPEEAEPIPSFGEEDKGGEHGDDDQGGDNSSDSADIPQSTSVLVLAGALLTGIGAFCPWYVVSSSTSIMGSASSFNVAASGIHFAPAIISLLLALSTSTENCQLPAFPDQLPCH